MIIKIPFVKKHIKIMKQSEGGSIENGNGYKHKTFLVSICTIIGNGNDESRISGIIRHDKQKKWKKITN